MRDEGCIVYVQNKIVSILKSLCHIHTYMLSVTSELRTPRKASNISMIQILNSETLSIGKEKNIITE
jgi:predicted P-loop ATPase/GTPase